MADYSLGTAHGQIKIDADTSGVTQAERALEGLGRTGQNADQALGKIGNTMGVAGLAIGAGLGVAVVTAASFEKGLDGIQAVSGATVTQMDKVRDAALRIGKDTAFSASEASQAMEELVKAGIPIEDVLNGAADATVALAAATGVDMPTAATIASNAMNVFGIEASDMDRVVNAFAQTANASAIDVTDLGMSMQAVGAVAALAGLSMEDTTIAIGQLGDAGIKGSDAGTSLKTMLMNLQPTTEAQTKAFKELGIITEDGSNRFFDAQGNVKSLRDIQEILKESTQGLTQEQKLMALETMFGSDAIRAAAVLADGGAASYDNFGQKMAASGTAADQARIRQENLAGSFERLKGSLETVAIGIGSVLIPMLTDLADWVGQIVDAFTELDPATQKVIVWAAAVSAGLLLMGSGIIKAVRYFKELRAAMILVAGMTGLTTLFQGIAFAAGVMWAAITLPIAIAIAAVLAVIAVFVLLYAKVEWFRDGVNAALGWVWDLMKQIASWVSSAFVAAWDALGTALGAVIDWVGRTFSSWDNFVAMLKAIPGQLADLVQWLMDLGGRALSGLVQGLQNALPIVAGWFGSLGSTIIGWLADAGSWLINEGPRILGGLLAGLVVGLVNVAQWFLGLRLTILGWLADAAVWLLGKGADIIGGLLNGAITGLAALGTWFVGLLPQILGWIGDTLQWLVQKGKDLGQGLINGMIEKSGDIAQWFFELPGKVAGWIGDVLSWLKQKGLDLIQGFIDGIQEKALEIGQWFLELPGKIAGWIGNTFEWIRTNGVDLIKGFIQGIWDHKEQIGIALLVIPGIILAAMVGIPLLLVTVGVALLAGFIKGVFQGIQDFAVWFAGKVAELAVAIAGWFADAGSWLLQAGKDIIQGLWDGIQEAWDTFLGWLGDIWQGLVDSFKSFFGINSPSTVFMQFGVDLIQGLINGIIGMVGSLLEGIGSIASSILGFFGDVGSWLLEAGGNLIGGLIDGIGGAIGAVGEAIGSVISGITDAFSGAVDWLAEAGGNVIEGLGNGIDAARGWLGERLTDVGDGIHDFFFGSEQWLTKPGNDLMTGLGNGIDSGRPGVVAAATNAANGIKSSFFGSGGWLVADGINAMAGATNGINAGSGGVRAASQNAANGIMGAWWGSGTWLYQDGVNLMAGLRNGIINMGGAAVAAAQSIASQVAAASKYALKIASPSKVFVEIGEFVSLGLAEGIESGAKNAVNSMSDVAQAITDAGVLGALSMSAGGPAAFWDASALAPGYVPPSREVASYSAAQGVASSSEVKYEFNTYNPVAERASDSEARRLRALSSLGAF